jgi:hypothetical protein
MCSSKKQCFEVCVVRLMVVRYMHCFVVVDVPRACLSVEKRSFLSL